jgi:uncharacterized protein YcbX
MSSQIDQVKNISLYPIKSCQAASVNGEEPSRLEVGPTGFVVSDVRDRDFVLVETEPIATGKRLFISQRGWDKSEKQAHKVDRRLASVAINITRDSLEIRSPIGCIAIAAEYDVSRSKCDVSIFGSILPQALDQGDEPAQYFSELLGRSVRLMRANRSAPRHISQSRQISGAANQTAAADACPFLLTSQTSLDASHSRNQITLGSVSIDRYRSNIVLSGAGIGPYGEDYVRKLNIGEMSAFVVKACARCPIPNNDQSTGKQVDGGLKVLRGRSGHQRGAPHKRGVFFGQNLNHIYESGQTVAVSDQVEIIERSDFPNVTI